MVHVSLFELLPEALKDTSTPGTTNSSKYKSHSLITIVVMMLSFGGMFSLQTFLHQSLDESGL